MGTIADVVPLVEENRVLVRCGLESLASFPPPGIIALIRAAGLTGKKHLDSETAAFQLAPRINAAGRLGQTDLALELLTTDDASQAAELAVRLDQLNSLRKEIQDQVLAAANQQVKELPDTRDCPALVLAGEGWHMGVIGIVAGKLANQYGRPVVLISWDEHDRRPGIGSGRGVLGFHLCAALDVCREFLVKHGGHEAAAGLKIYRDDLKSFRSEFCPAATEQFSALGNRSALRVDAEFPLSAFTLQTVGQIEQLGPFGEGNKRPVFCATGVTPVDARTAGRNNRELLVKLAQYGVVRRAVAFGSGHRLAELSSPNEPLDIVFHARIDEFQGYRRVDLELLDWRKATR